jgi:hypothetical protein
MNRRWILFPGIMFSVLTPLWVFAGLALLGPVAHAQLAPRGILEPANPAEEKADGDEAKKKDEEAKPDEPAEVIKPAVPVNPKLIMLHLLDGSKLAGELTIDRISVATEFGELEVPLIKVRSIRPGLESSPELAKQVLGTIEALGSDDYKAREQAHKDLVAMGLKVHHILEEYRNDENAERKRHVGEILKAFEELVLEQQELAEAGETVEPPLIKQDTVVTDDFSIVGKVSPDVFKLNSKYGELTVNLADLKEANRPRAGKETIRKLVQVPGDNLVQRSFKSSNIRVEAGDKISIRADGSVVMTPWGNEMSSTPDGGANYGWYVPNQIYGGALVAKIGERGQVFKVGSKSTFVAKTSGVLQFAIAMQQQYSQQGYNFPGQYNVRVTVGGD